MKLPPFQPKYALHITIGALLLYELLGHLPYPLYPVNKLYNFPDESRSILAFLPGNLLSIGFIAASLGFWLIEILSFFIPPLKQARQKGKEGRAMLTRWSIFLSLSIAGYFAIHHVMGISLQITSLSNLPPLPEFSLLHQILYFVFLMFGFTVVITLAETITRYGIGNGFCVLILYWAVKGSVIEMIQYLEKIKLEDKTPNFAGILLLFALIIVVARYVRPKVVPASNAKTYFNFELSPLPMGIFALGWYYQVFNMAYFIPGVAWDTFSGDNEWRNLLMFSALWGPIAWVGYFLVSHPQRISSNTFGRVQFDPGWENQVRMGLKYSILIVGAVWLVMNASLSGEYYERLIFPLFDTVSLLLAYFIILDLIAQWRFNRNAPDQKLLGTFDNVHFMTYLKGLFEKEGIRFCIQGFQYRRLFFFWEPLIKMRLLVDARDEARARELADFETVPII